MYSVYDKKAPAYITVRSDFKHDHISQHDNPEDDHLSITIKPTLE